jgi:uncharacterized Zn-finger protein
VYLQRHNRVHTGERPYQCDTCNNCFKSSSNLKEHKFTHAETRQTVECNVCKKSYAGVSSLCAHMRIHTGYRPHVCECGKAFTKSADLQRHSRIHTGEKPYQCDLCERGFKRSEELSLHKRIHTNELPFERGMLNNKFSETGYLKLHNRTHTKYRFYQEKKEDKEIRSQAYSSNKTYQCNRLFVSLTSVQQHRLQVQAASSNLIGCGLCGTIYSIEQDI